MSLHGTIEVNNERLGVWMARRTTPLAGHDAEHDYACEVVWSVPSQSWDTRRSAFTLRHRYSDGATTLAAKVLATAAADAPRPPVPTPGSTDVPGEGAR